KKDENGNIVRDANGDAVLEEKYSVKTGTVLTIDTKAKKLLDSQGNVLVDVASAFTPQKVEFMKAGGSYAVTFGKKIQTFTAETLCNHAPVDYASYKAISPGGQGLTADHNVFNLNAVCANSYSPLLAASVLRVTLNIVRSPDTTSPMTCQELASLAAA